MSETAETQNVEVEVTLTGGLRYSSVLPSTSPILRDLYIALGSKDLAEPQRSTFLVQLPIDGGTSACSFMSSSLVALQTRPPVLIQSETPQPPSAEAATSHAVIEDFLTPGENERLLAYAFDNEAAFEGSGVIAQGEGHRKSRVLFGIKHSKWRDLFLSRMKLHLPYVLLALNTPHFRLGDFEIQLTASNDGDYYRAHADRTPEQAIAANRQITYVYYLHREPRPFAGGGLLLYGGRPDSFVYANARSVIAVEPRNNCLVLFGSQRWHELDVVRCPSGEFADSRFTVNGWLHPAAAS